MSDEQFEGMSPNAQIAIQQQGYYASNQGVQVQYIQANQYGETPEGAAQQQQQQFVPVYLVPVNGGQVQGGPVVVNNNQQQVRIQQPVNQFQPKTDKNATTITLEVHDYILEKKTKVLEELGDLQCFGCIKIPTGIRILCVYDGLVWLIVALIAGLLEVWTVLILALIILPFPYSGYRGATTYNPRYLRFYMFYLCLEAIVIVIAAAISGQLLGLLGWAVWLCFLIYCTFLLLRLIKAIEKVEKSMVVPATA